MHLTYGAEKTFHEMFFIISFSNERCRLHLADAWCRKKKNYPLIYKKTILSCQNHGTIKEKLYKAGIKKGSVIFFFKKIYSSVVFDVFIEHVSYAFKFSMQISVPFKSADNFFR